MIAVNAQYPFNGFSLSRPGGRLHYLDEGSGQPIVMVHGNPTWSFYYRRLADALRRTHRVIVPDHLGCGLSEKPSLDQYGYTLAERVDDFAALMDHCGVRGHVTLVLHDWGGVIGMAWAARYPERIARLVLLNTAAFGLPPTKSFPWALRLVRDTRFGAWLVLRLNAFCRAAAWIGCQRRPMPPRIRRMYLAPYNCPAHRLAVWKFVQTIPLQPNDPGFDLVQQAADGLRHFQNTPTLIVWGLRDFVFDRHFLKEWRRRLPRAEVHAFRDAGHYVLEDAAEEVVPLITRFVMARRS